MLEWLGRSYLPVHEKGSISIYPEPVILAEVLICFGPWRLQATPPELCKQRLGPLFLFEEEILINASVPNNWLDFALRETWNFLPY